MEPLKVTFTFASPVVRNNGYPLFLDGLLAWCVMDDATEAEDLNPWEAAEDLSVLLDREDGASGNWVWKASAITFKPASDLSWINMTRRCDPLLFMKGKDGGAPPSPLLESHPVMIAAAEKVEVAAVSGDEEALAEAEAALLKKRWSSPTDSDGVLNMRAEGVNSRSGQMRGYQWLIAYQWMEKAEAWCVGDRCEIEGMLSRLDGMGKLTRNGFGLIRDFKVEPDPAAANLWRRRALPQGMQGAAGVEYASALSCLRAPYWRKTAQVAAQVPV